MASLQVGVALTGAGEVTVKDQVPLPGTFAGGLVWQGLEGQVDLQTD